MSIRTLAGLAAALLVATPALAADPDQVVVSVSTGDLDLGSANGAATLDRRLDGAARQICGRIPGRDFTLQRVVSACREEVLAGARARADTMIAAARGAQTQLAARSR